jgi:hypothetical protein
MKMLEGKKKQQQHKFPFFEILKLWILQIPFRQSELELMILYYN